MKVFFMVMQYNFHAHLDEARAQKTTSPDDPSVYATSMLKETVGCLY